MLKQVCLTLYKHGLALKAARPAALTPVCLLPVNKKNDHHDHDGSDDDDAAADDDDDEEEEDESESSTQAS